MIYLLNLLYMKMKEIVFFLVLLLIMTGYSQENFKNPVLAGFYPDPSICKAGDDYYLVNSTFSYFPGVPVFHSTDLVHWKQVGHVLNRPSQLNIVDQEVSEGIFAPAIVYHEGIFYMITTFVQGGGNFVVTTENPEGPWSDPVWLPDVRGIDPSIFFDDDGKAYIVHNGEPPDNKPRYGGHRALWILEFDPASLKTTSKPKLLVNGGTDMAKKPIWIEGPHIFKHKGFYYLIAAEGGTGYNHSEVVFRSENVYGPYESYKGNPILTQRHLDPDRRLPVTNTGHADIIQTKNGEWYAVFLGCRPYEENYFNTGRETFMAPVTWINGWPVINADSDIIRYSYPLPNLQMNENEDFPKNGNFILKDDFDGEILANYWVFLRTPRKKRYHLNNGMLEIPLRPEMLTEKKNVSCIFRRQQHTKCIVTASLEFVPEKENEQAGITAFQNESHFYLLARTLEKGHDAIVLLRGTKKEKTSPDILVVKTLENSIKSLYLKIEMAGDTVKFYYSENNEKWNLLYEGDAKILSTEMAGGFVGTMFGVYASSNGFDSKNIARYDWFTYEGDDDIYK